MFIFLCIIFAIVSYIVMAGATHGYAKHRWPYKRNEYSYSGRDTNEDTRLFAALFWPFYWTFVWPFTKANEVTFSRIEKEAAQQIARNRARIEDLRASREAVEASNVELEAAELELEKEVSKSL
jgi:hypothetical protein